MRITKRLVILFALCNAAAIADAQSFYLPTANRHLFVRGEEEKFFNRFKFSNQVFAWEKIFVFRISNRSSRGWWPPMYIVMPMKYKSFVTHITLTDIVFQSGKVIFLTNYNAFYNDSENMKFLDIDQSLKNYKTVDVKIFPLQELLEKN